MVWQDTSVTTDIREFVEAPEGTVFEPFVIGLVDTKTERVESIGADGTTVIDTFEIPEEARELIKDGIDSTYCNRFEFVDDKVNLISQCPTIVLNGTEEWTVSAIDSPNGYFFIRIGDFGTTVKGKCISDQYPSVTISSSNTNVGIYITNSSNGEDRLIIRPQDVASIDGATFKKQLMKNPVTVRYALTNPEVTDITHLFTDDNKIKVERGGALRFVNEREQSVPNTIAYVTRKE
jgi:hypothetical protein